jgi:hypothetical protein
LDGNPKNNQQDNLAFLCLPHYDEYDSRTSVSKGLTIEEVKHYRQRLYATHSPNAPQGLADAHGKSHPSSSRKGSVKVEPFFWLAQTLVAWFTSRMDLSWQILEQHAASVSVDVKPFSQPSEVGLDEAMVAVREQLQQSHGQLPACIFSLGVMVALLPFGFSSPDELRRAKATLEGLALKEFGSEVLVVTTSFLRDLPCEIPTFVEKVESFKQSLQSVV